MRAARSVLPSRPRLGLGLGLLALGSAIPWSACKREPAQTPVLDARPDARAPEPAAAAPVPEAPRAPAVRTTESAAIPEGEITTVEFSGAVSLPAGPPPKEPLMLYVTEGDCLRDDARLIRRVPVTDNRTFLVNVLLTPGSQITLCAALMPQAGAAVTLYGQAEARFTVPKTDPTVYEEIGIRLTTGPPHVFPSTKR